MLVRILSSEYNPKIDQKSSFLDKNDHKSKLAQAFLKIFF